ncbi:MAG: ABC-2 family transporter protein [SAR324 cluster bacterium]|nr:ABC-2 family transporter protein [SAR324 cluster bacterium]
MINRITTTTQKWWQTMLVCWSNVYVYRINFLLQIIGPAIVFFFIKYSLWFSIFQGDFSREIGGYTLSSMLEYHLWTLVVSVIGLGNSGHELSQDIRMGRITSYFIYPFSLWEFHMAQFLAMQVVKIFTASLVIGLSFTFLDQIFTGFSWQACLNGWLMSMVVALFWFMVQYMIGLLAFWLEETWTFRVIIHTVTQFFSGAIIPLDLYPQWMRQALEYTPFPYLVYQPVHAFSGRAVDVGWSITILCFWILITSALTLWVWKRGVRLYTAAGM